MEYHLPTTPNPSFSILKWIFLCGSSPNLFLTNVATLRFTRRILQSCTVFYLRTTCFMIMVERYLQFTTLCSRMNINFLYKKQVRRAHIKPCKPIQKTWILYKKGSYFATSTMLTCHGTWEHGMIITCQEWFLCKHQSLRFLFAVHPTTLVASHRAHHRGKTGNICPQTYKIFTT